VRPDTTPEALAALKPYIKQAGTITAGHASATAIVAGMVLLAGQRGLEKLGVQPMARVVASVTVGGDPRNVFITPIEAGRRVCDKAGWRLGQVELWEINEAFAAEMVVVLRALELDLDKVNVNGGAIALGHPVGATGARMVATLLHEMRRRGAARGLATLCVSGGLGMAVAFERL
jgi:acetyl-CoA C-acetyltransferase